MCQMCSHWCHRWRGQKILNLSTLRKYTVTLDMPYIHIQYHRLFGTQKYSTDFCYNFLTTVPYLGNPICTAYILVKTDCCHLLNASIGLLHKNSPYQQTLRIVWWRQRALTWAWILLRGRSSKFHRTRMQNIPIFPTSFRTVPSEVCKNGS